MQDPLTIHWVQHVPFEGLGYIEEWAQNRNIIRSCTRLYAGEKLPEVDAFDLLIIMGGPMGIHDHEAFPWLIAEKEFIRLAINAGKPTLGICLGAQLMADALGAKVYPGPQKEIGWFPIVRSPEAPELIPESLTVFHWHGDTFEIPDGAVPLATSAPGINQGFIFGSHAVGLQFHMETTPESMESLIVHCADELASAAGGSAPPFVQSAADIRRGQSNIECVNAAMKQVLNTLID